jgi:adenylate cyclase
VEPPKKNWRKEYVGSLQVAYIMGAISVFFFRGVSSWQALVLVYLVSGFVFGTLFFAVGALLPKAKFRSFWLTAFARSVVVGVVLVVGMCVVIPLAIGLNSKTGFWGPRMLRDTLFTLRYFLPQAIAMGLAMSFVINSLFQVDSKLGPGTLWKWATGKYHNPKEEERIFMFLDLKNSTTLAEKLGNIKFSRLCQDFFRDLSQPVSGTKGEVSHYIGDEAVLCWQPGLGLPSANCLLCFFYMQGAIAKRASYYLKEYGFVPEFKAGVHIGLVVAAEVGEIKSEIVYHGDVLNTTARITGLCSEFNSNLLISGDLLGRLALPEIFESRSFGPQLLKGKEHEVEVVAIDLAASAPRVPMASREMEPVG